MERDDKHSVFHFKWKDSILFGSYKILVKTGNVKDTRETERIASSQHKCITDIAVLVSTTHFHTFEDSGSISNNLN